jgi:hypothetical protein
MITRTRSLPAFALICLSLLAFPCAAFAGTVQAWLLISGDFKDSVISTDQKERDMLEDGGWKINGTALLQTTPQKGTSDLHRLARAGKDATDRILEADPAKIAAYVKQGFTDEGGLGLVSLESKPGLVPVYHFTKDKRHFWLINKSDQPAAEAKGWKSAGVSFWVWPVTAQPAAPASSKAKTPAR